MEKAASKIQKWYRQHLYFISRCKNIQNDPKISKKFLIECIFYGLHVNQDFKPISLGGYQYAHELKLAIHKISLEILFNKGNLKFTPNQVKKILSILTNEQLLFIGFGVDPKRK